MLDSIRRTSDWCSCILERQADVRKTIVLAKLLNDRIGWLRADDLGENRGIHATRSLRLNYGISNEKLLYQEHVNSTTIIGCGLIVALGIFIIWILHRDCSKLFRNTPLQFLKV